MSVADEIKALTFDVFGTVVDWRTSVARQVRSLARNKGLEVDAEAFADAWRARYQPAMSKVRDGEIRWMILDELHRMNLDELLEEFSITGLSEAEVDHLNKAWHRLDPWPDSVLGLTRLKKRFILATLSNGNVALIVNMARYAGLPWDAVLGAEIARHYKPQPEAYAISAERLGLKPEQCMMVAAHNDDLVHASKVGLRTAFVSRPTEYGPNQKVDFRAEHDFDFVADDFLDLADQLGT